MRFPNIPPWSTTWNVENHKGSVNENYGRELLELFSIGEATMSKWGQAKLEANPALLV